MAALLLAPRVRLRRPVGGGHFLFGLGHYPFLLLALLVVVVVVIYLRTRR